MLAAPSLNTAVYDRRFSLRTTEGPSAEHKLLVLSLGSEGDEADKPANGSGASMLD